MSNEIIVSMLPFLLQKITKHTLRYVETIGLQYVVSQRGWS